MSEKHALHHITRANVVKWVLNERDEQSVLLGVLTYADCRSSRCDCGESVRRRRCVWGSGDGGGRHGHHGDCPEPWHSDSTADHTLRPGPQIAERLLDSVDRLLRDYWTVHIDR